MEIVKSLKEVIETKIAYNKSSVVDIAKKAGVSIQFLNDVISGEKQPQPELLGKLAHYLQMNAYETDELYKIAALQKTPGVILADYIKKTIMLEIIKKQLFKLPKSDEDKNAIYSVKVGISKFICMFSEEELKVKVDHIKDNFLITEIINKVIPFLENRKDTHGDVEEATIEIIPKINIYARVDVIGNKEKFSHVVDRLIVPHLLNVEDVIGLKAKDATMQPAIEPGDSVVFRMGKKPEDGDIVVFSNSEQVGFRYFRKFENTYYLMESNPIGPPIKYSGNSDIKILGKVIKVIKDY